MDVAGIMNGTKPDVPLKNEDVLFIPTQSDKVSERTVTITGLVMFPGSFQYADNMSVEDLIVQAGGLRDQASTARVDVSRRIIDPKATTTSHTISQSFSFSLKDGLIVDGDKSFTLEPYDVVHVRRSPGYYTPRHITVSGEVVFEGQHTLETKTMRLSDAWTIANKVSSKELMRRAGEGIFRRAKWSAPVGIVCGKGNNAGDGFVVASLLKDAGIPCDIILISDSFSEDGKYYYDICKEKGVNTIMFQEGIDLSGYGSLLDCIFGTGFSGEPRGLYSEAIDAVNSSGAYIVSADINSGLNGDTGLGSRYVVSDLTVSIGDFKTGHFAGLAYGAMKERANVDIGIEIRGDYELIREPDLIVLVDLDTGEEKHFRDADSFGPMDMEFAGLDYFERTERYADEYVAEQDLEMFRETMQLEKIREAIAAGRVHSLVYHAMLCGSMRTVETAYIPYRAGLCGDNLAVKTVRRIG